MSDQDTHPREEFSNLPQALQFAFLEEGKEGQFVNRCYNLWNEHYSTYEEDDAKRNWKHFRMVSDDLEDKKAKQKRTGNTTSTYYTPSILPAILTRTAVFLDTIAQQDPLVMFSPREGADINKVKLQQSAVNYWLEQDGFLIKEIERIIDQELYKYSCTKVFLKDVDRHEYVTPSDGPIMLEDGSVVNLEDMRLQYAALAQSYGLPTELPSEVIEKFVNRSRSFQRRRVSQQPTCENVPNGRFLYDPTQKNRNHWRFAGDIEPVSYVWLREHARALGYDPKRLDRLEKLLRTQDRGVSEWKDYYWDIMTSIDAHPDPKNENFFLAKCELYVKVLNKDKQPRIKRLHAILNVIEDPKQKSETDGGVFMLSDPEDSPFELVDFPYALGYTYKMPHTMLGIPTADIGSDMQDQINEFSNLSIDQARWTLFNMLFKRKGVRASGELKIEPGRINELSDISEAALRVVNLSQGNPGDMANKLASTEERARTLMSAVDTLQAISPGSSEEPLGSIKLRREAGITKINLTGLYVGDCIVQIAEMFRDLGAQVAKKGIAMKLGDEIIKLTADDFLEMSSAKVMNIMRLASHQDRLVKAKELYNMVVNSPLIQTRAQLTGDYRAVWHAMRRYMVELGEKGIEQMIGKLEDATIQPQQQQPAGATPAGPQPAPQGGAA